MNRTITTLMNMGLTTQEAIYLFAKKPITACNLANGDFTPEDILKILNWLDFHRSEFM